MIPDLRLSALGPAPLQGLTLHAVLEALGAVSAPLFPPFAFATRTTSATTTTPPQYSVDGILVLTLSANSLAAWMAQETVLLEAFANAVSESLLAGLGKPPGATLLLTITSKAFAADTLAYSIEFTLTSSTAGLANQVVALLACAGADTATAAAAGISALHHRPAGLPAGKFHHCAAHPGLHPPGRAPECDGVLPRSCCAAPS